MVDQIRKPISDEVNDSDEEYKKSKTQEIGNAKPSGRGSRGRGRGRGRGGRAARVAERDREMEQETTMVEPQPPQYSIKSHVPESSVQENENVDGLKASNEDTKQHLQSPREGIDIDLNDESVDLNERLVSHGVAPYGCDEEHLHGSCEPPT